MFISSLMNKDVVVLCSEVILFLSAIVYLAIYPFYMRVFHIQNS